MNFSLHLSSRQCRSTDNGLRCTDLDEGEDDKQGEPDDVGDANEEMTDDALPTEKFPEGEAPEALPEEVPDLDQSLGGNEVGQSGGEGAQDSGATTIPESAAAADPSIQPGAQTEVEPTREEGEKDEKKDGNEEDANNEEEDTTADSDPALTAPSNAADGQTKQRSSTSDPKSDPARSRQNQPSPAETQRSLGDALQSWKRRLEALSDLKEPEADKPDAESLDVGEEEGEVEFVQDGDEKDSDAQALGPASEEQVQGLEGLRLGEDDDQQSFEPDAMDVDTDAPSLIPPTSTVQLDAATLTDSHATAIPATELRDDLDRAVEDNDEMEEEDVLRDQDEEMDSTTIAKPLLLDPELDLEVEQTMLQWKSGEESELTADGVWRLYEGLTRDLSYALTEQLRLILEPTLATRLKGDYRSGKRLNMKKIIPYIASEFTKDKIYLRRTRASKREYEILIAVDDSKSMQGSAHLVYETLALVTQALSRLEVGNISIARFGETADLLSTSKLIGGDDGATLLNSLSFSQRTTNVKLLVERTIQIFDEAQSRSTTTSSDLWRLSIILSDGVLQDQAKLSALLRLATEKKIFFVFVIIDSLTRPTTETPSIESTEIAQQSSIVDMKSVAYSKGKDGKLELQMTRYLDSFPFNDFVVLRDVTGLPEVLSGILSQFFERVSFFFYLC